MARILDGFRRELPEPNLTYNVGVIGGGTPATIDEQGLAITASGKTNIVAETAIARGDIRTLTAEQEARVRARMQAIVAQHLPRTEATLVFAEDGYPPMAPTEGNRALLARAQPRSIATSACRKCRNMTRRGAARRIRASSPATSIRSPASARRAAAPMPRANMSSSTA